jgi:hypothetical protein
MDVISFGKLDHATMSKIVKKFVDELKALDKDKNIHVKPNAATRSASAPCRRSKHRNGAAIFCLAKLYLLKLLLLGCLR